MACSIPIICIGALLVVASTAAPLSSQEEAPNVEQPDESGDRAKRAEEEIYFGNQQNKNRIMAKKSDLSHLIASSQPQGEPDMGAEVIVHKEMPVEEDLASRAEAALGGIEADEKMAEAVEAAMQSAADAAEPHEETGGQTDTSGSEEVEDQPPKTQEEGEGEDEGQEEEEEEEEVVEGDEEEDDEEEEDGNKAEAVSDENTPNESEEQPQSIETSNSDDSVVDEQELQGSFSPVHQYPLEDVASSAIDEEESSDVGGVPDAEDDELNQFLQEFQEQEGEKEALDLRQPEVESDRPTDYYPNMYQYMMSSPSRGRDFFLNMPYLYQDYRRRRSAGMANKRTRRIKRDLLDDTYFNPYNSYTVPYSPVDVNDALISDPDEYVPLTEEEAEYLYKRLLDYFADASAVQGSPYEDVEEEEMLPYAPEYEPVDEEKSISYAPESFAQEASSPYEEGYPYGPIDFDSYTNYVKRGMLDRYPVEASKRYFFPFSQEPYTHWGAFVPEKRDYNEAIQRLQRLAMALSDNPGPYYGEMENYRRK